MNKQIRFAAIVVLGALWVAAAHAGTSHASGHEHGNHAPAMTIGQPGNASEAASAEPATSAAALTEGEVRKVDLDNKKLTLRHGPLPNLDMPGMTMVFQVKDEGMLQGIQTGDKVRFAADRIDGKFTVVRIERAN